MAFGIGVAIALSGAYYHFATPVASAKQASPPTALSPVVLQAYFRFAEDRLYAGMEACIAIANAREMYPLTQEGDEFKTIEMKTDQVLRDAQRNSGLSDEQAATSWISWSGPVRSLGPRIPRMIRPGRGRPLHAQRVIRRAYPRFLGGRFVKRRSRRRGGGCRGLIDMRRRGRPGRMTWRLKWRDLDSLLRSGRRVSPARNGKSGYFHFEFPNYLASGFKS